MNEDLSNLTHNVNFANLLPRLETLQSSVLEYVRAHVIFYEAEYGSPSDLISEAGAQQPSPLSQ